MNKIGFIGLGNMGGVLLRSLLKFGAFDPADVIVSTRTPGKIKDLISAFPGLRVAKSNRALAAESRTIFIGVRTGDVRDVLLDIRPSLRANVHFITISGGLTAKNIAKIYNGKLTKVIPSVTCEAGQSVSLVFHNPKVSLREAGEVERWLSCLGLVKVIDEDQFEIGADMTSCAPAFIASLFKHFTEAGLKHSRFGRQDVEDMVLMTLLGTATLLYEKKRGFDSLIAQVATKGGMTEEGLKVFDRYIPAVFDEVLEATLKKHAIVKQNMDELFANQEDSQ